MTLSSKLHIDLPQGIVEVEGDTDFVREVYSELKEKILAREGFSPTFSRSEATKNNSSKSSSKPKQRSSPRKTSKSQENVGGIDPDFPQLDKYLDTSKLSAFFDRFAPKNHSEKILVFVRFLKDVMGLESPNTDQVFTCYIAMNEKVPTAFKQAFYAARGGEYGYIDYSSPTEIKVSVIGNNRLLDLQKSAE